MTPATTSDKQRDAGRAFRFLLFGAFNTAITYAIFCLLLLWLSAQWAYAAAYVLGIGIAYWGNVIWVFGGRLRLATAAAYPAMYAAQYLLNAGLIAVLAGWLGWDPRVALAVALVLVTPLSFLANRRLLARLPKAPPEA